MEQNSKARQDDVKLFRFPINFDSEIDSLLIHEKNIGRPRIRAHISKIYL